MWPDRVSNPGPLTYKSGALPTVLHGESGLVDRVLALHAGSRGYDSHRGHMSERFF